MSARVVLDASALLRATIEGSSEALAVLRSVACRERKAMAPDLVWAEVANALVLRVRMKQLTQQQARTALEYLLGLPIDTRPIRPLTLATLSVALRRDLSAYDASYLALAEAAEATLVTADTDFAGTYERLEVIV